MPRRPFDHELGEFAENEPETTNLRWGIATIIHNLGLDAGSPPMTFLVKELETYFRDVAKGIVPNSELPLEDNVDMAAQIANTNLEYFDTDGYQRATEGM